MEEKQAEDPVRREPGVQNGSILSSVEKNRVARRDGSTI